MDVGVIERVIVHGARRNATGFGRSRQRENLEISEGRGRVAALIGFVIADGGPQRGLAEKFWIDVEYGILILVIGGLLIGIVPQHQPYIRGAVTGKPPVGVANADGSAIGRSTVAKHPDPRGLTRAGERRRQKSAVRPADQWSGGPSNRVKILRAGRQPLQGDDMIGDKGGV